MQSFTVHLQMMDIHSQRDFTPWKTLSFQDRSHQTRVELAQALSGAWEECRRTNQLQQERRRSSGPSGLFGGIRQDLAGITRRLDRVLDHMEGRSSQRTERDPEYGIHMVVRPQDPTGNFHPVAMLIPVNARETDPRTTYRMAGEVLQEALGANLLE